MSSNALERVLLPIAEENDAAETCVAVEPYLGQKSDVVVVHVIEKTKGGPDKAPLDARKEQAEEMFEIVRDRLGTDDRDVYTELRYDSDIVDEILETAEEHDATAIGFTPRPGSRWVKLLAGNRAQRLTSEAELPVLVFPHPDKETPELPKSTKASDETNTEDIDDSHYNVLVPIDGSDLSWEALEHACSVYPGSNVTVLHVLESATSGVYDAMTGEPSSEDRLDERNRKQEVSQLFDEAQTIADEYDVTLSTMTLTGNIVNAIVTCAEETDIDIIVMARHGRTGLKQRLLGSTTESIVRWSPVPVTIIR